MNIEEDQFAKLPVEEQRLAIFRGQNRLEKILSSQLISCNGRFKKIEKRRWVNTGASAGGGLLGGFLAMLLKIMFWK